MLKVFPTLRTFAAMNTIFYALLALSLAANIFLLILYFHSRWSYNKIMSKNLNNERKKEESVDKISFDPLLAKEDHDKLLLQLLLKCMEEEKNYLNPSLGIQDLADLLGTSKTKLSHLINSTFQQNFPSFVNHYRVHESIPLLSDLNNFDLNIVDIGEKCGFTSRQAFHSAFKKEMGITPTHFRIINRMKERQG